VLVTAFDFPQLHACESDHAAISLSTWVDNWEQAMAIAKDKEVLATTRASEWFEDFLITVREIQPS
jgi:hypothetical protein